MYIILFNKTEYIKIDNKFNPLKRKFGLYYRIKKQDFSKLFCSLY